MRLLITLTLFSSVLFSPWAHAQEDETIRRLSAITPHPAYAHQDISAVFQLTTGCSALPDGPLTLSRQGNTLTLHGVDSLLGPCIGVLPPPAFLNFPLGTLPAGNYTLIYAPTNQLGDPLPSQSLEFTVIPPMASAHSVPSLSFLSLLVITSLLGWSASRAYSVKVQGH